MDLKSWQGVAIVLGALGSLVTLILFHADTSTVLTFLLAIGVGGTAGMLHGVRNQVNGNVTKLTDLIQSAMDKLAQSTPPPAPPADSEPPKDGEQ